MDVEVIVGHDAEELVHLVEHLTVLSGDDDDRIETLVVAHGGHQGGELDRLRAGAVDEHDPQGGGPFAWSRLSWGILLVVCREWDELGLSGGRVGAVMAGRTYLSSVIGVKVTSESSQ